jgi:hypothetical protein
MPDMLIASSVFASTAEFLILLAPLTELGEEAVGTTVKEALGVTFFSICPTQNCDVL